MAYAGIDYGLGQSNIDKTNGIRYGVISQNSINLDCTDSFEYDYGKPTCPECGREVIDSAADTVPEDTKEWKTHGCNDYACLECKAFWDSGDVFSECAIGWNYDGEGYQLTNCPDSDIFVIKSPFYTFAQFCSPCVPGAGNLNIYTPDGAKTYCLGHDWFDGGRAPYPVFSVEIGEQVNP